MQPPITDERITALVLGCQRGESAAVEQLYELYADRLHRYLLTRVGSAENAADLTTEVFLRVIQHIGGFRLNPQRPAATVSAWLYRIAANLAAEHHRAQRRAPWVALEAEGAGAPRLPGPERLVEERENFARLAQAMSGLSEEQRLVIIGKFAEAMSNAEIATWLGKTEGAVKSLQHRALHTLARLLGTTDPPRQGQPWLSFARK